MGVEEAPQIDNWKPWEPLPGPQTDCIKSLADEVFYGGQAGGSKTNTLVGLALHHHLRSTLFRKTFKELKDLITEIRETGGPNVRVSESAGYAVTTDGRTISLGYMQHEKDKEKYRGHPSDLVGIDEVTMFTESQIEFVTSWLRTKFPDQRLRVVLTGNPPTTTSGLWIIEAFAPWLSESFPEPAEPKELRWYARLDGKVHWFRTGEPFEHRDKRSGKLDLVYPKSRTFIPAGLKDNPYLSRDKRYVSVLQGKPEPIRSQLLYGDFTIGLLDDAWQVIPSAWIRAAQSRWTPDGQNGRSLTRSGLDCQYGGSDRMALARRYDDWVAPIDVWTSADISPLAEAAEGNLIGKASAELVTRLVGGTTSPVNVDVIGYGAATYEALIDQQVKAIPVNFGAGANGIPDARGVLEFANERARFYWQLRDALDPDLGSMLALPPDDVTPGLRAELAATKYERRGGRIFIRPKEEVAAEIGRSPDLADCVALSVGEIPQPTVDMLGD